MYATSSFHPSSLSKESDERWKDEVAYVAYNHTQNYHSTPYKGYKMAAFITEFSSSVLPFLTRKKLRSTLRTVLPMLLSYSYVAKCDEGLTE
jgi:hypothetical protein